jgi:hypothetical protein
LYKFPFDKNQKPGISFLAFDDEPIENKEKPDNLKLHCPAAFT